MFNTRTYRVRGKPIQMQESTDVVAIRPAAVTTKPGRAKKPGAPPKRVSMHAMGPQVPEADVRALENAGWVFVKSHEAPVYGKGIVAAKVFLKPGGGLALGTDRLTIKLKHGDDTKAAQTLLARYGVRVLNALKFAPGLYDVAVDSSRDVFDVADDLLNAGVVEFVEPVFLEVLGHR